MALESAIGGRAEDRCGISVAGRYADSYPPAIELRASSDRLEVLAEAGIAISRGLELEETLEQIVDAARRVTGARYAALGVLGPDGRILRFIVSGLEPAQIEQLGAFPTGQGILGVVITEGRPLRLRDISSDPRSVGFPPSHPPMRSFLGVPVQARGATFGNLYLTEAAEGEFTTADERVVQVLALQAGVAIENARLYADAQEQAAAARRSAQARSALATIAGSILRERDVGRVMTTLATEAKRLVGARIVAIGVPDEVSGTVRFPVAVGDGADQIRGRELPLDGSVSGTVMLAGEAIRLDAVATTAVSHRETAEAAGMRTLLVAPMMAGDEAVAVATAIDASREEGFSADDQEALEALAALGAVALQTARAFGRERSRSEALERLHIADAEAQGRRQALARVVDAQEHERRRIAQDLHDRTAGGLAAIQLGLKQLEHCANAAEVITGLRGARADIASIIDDLRDLIVDLRPRVLDDFGLAPAIERLCDSVARRSGLRMRCAAAPEVNDIPPAIATVAYRITQEALTNIVRHARATHASVSAAIDDGDLMMAVEDDGIGIDDEAPTGDGVEGMRERAALVGGRLELAKPTGGGTRVIFEAPL